jgi:glutamate racemase
MAKRTNAYDDVAELYDRAFPSIGLRQREYDWFLAHARPAKSEVLVDVGCGNGRLIEAAAPLVKKAIGVDPAAEMIRLAGKNLARLKNATVKKAPGEKTGLPSACADVVVSFFSFRYLDWEKGLREILRLLKPGGRLVIIDMLRNPDPGRHLFPLLAAKLRTLWLIAGQSGARSALLRLVRHPRWRALLDAHPPRGFGEFQHLIAARFPLARFTVLDRGRKAQTIAFCSGPIDLFAEGPRRERPKLAVMDWGIGGLGFWRLFKKRHPRVPVLYLSDAGFTPYGKAGAPALRRRLTSIVEWLRLNGVRHLVVACNAMSSALDGFEPGPEIELTGVIRPTTEYLAVLGEKGVGIIGGNRTIRSGAYVRALASAGIKPGQRATQRLSAFIEAGDIASPEFKAYLERAVAPVADLPLLVLACTHYPAAEKPIRALVKGRLVDPALLTLDWVEEHWQLSAATGGRDVFLTTGDPGRMVASAKRMFGVAIGQIRQIDL